MDMLKEILPHLNTIIAAVAVWLLQKWLHIEVQSTQVQSLLDAIVQEIVEVERKPGLTGLQKKAEVIERVAGRFQTVNDPVFTAVRRSLLKRVFGSLEVAVEKAFQLSHLAYRQGSAQ